MVSTIILRVVLLNVLNLYEHIIDFRSNFHLSCRLSSLMLSLVRREMKHPMSLVLRVLLSRVVLMLLIVAGEDFEATEVEAEVEIDLREKVEMMRRKMVFSLVPLSG